MLNNCGHALSQGDRIDFHLGHTWEASPPWLENLCEKEKKESWGPYNFGVSGDHVALGCSLFPCGLGSRIDLSGEERGERTLAGGPGGGAMWVWIKNLRSWQQHS